MYTFYNPNPRAARVGDCAVRAVSMAVGKTWEQTFVELMVQGLVMGDMPSANNVWGAYLKRHGFKKHMIPDQCPDCYTISEFAKDHPHGVYVVAVSNHVVCIVNGDWCDTWDSGHEVPIYFWEREQ